MAASTRTDHDAGARIARLEADLAAASRLERELAEKTAALEAANAELRNLTESLDHIVRERTSALVESEAQLRRRNEELARLGRMKSEFVSIAAHELRTPMTSLVGYLDLLVDGRLGRVPTYLTRPIRSLHRNVHRLRRLVDDMLDVSRLDSGRVALVRAPCSLGRIAIAVVEEMRPHAAAKAQRLDTEIEDDPPIVADGDRLHRVVANLCAYSIKHTPDGGHIRVRVDRAASGETAGMARLRVRDNGQGIPAAGRARIFEPFSDAQPAKHHTSSGPDPAGLGLYIAKGLVELHGGSINVESETDKFSELTVLLPLVTGASP